MEVIDSVLYDGVTVVFMYLQAQGLKKVLKYLRNNPNPNPNPVQTYYNLTNPNPNRKKVLKYLRNNPIPLRVVTFSYQFARLTPQEEATKRKVFVEGKWDEAGNGVGGEGGHVTMPMFFYTIGGQSETPFKPKETR